MTLLQLRAVPAPAGHPVPTRDGRTEAARASAGFMVDRLDALDAAAHRDAWADLAGRTLEDNAFLHPDFALPAAQHLSAGRWPWFVLVWAMEGEDRGPLVAVCPISARHGALRGLASAWMHDLSTLGLPLLDRARAVEALGALLDWGTARLGAAGLILPSLPADGPTMAALDAAAGARGLVLAPLAAWERAALRRGGTRAGLAALSAKGAKELRRQRRRLAERGSLAFASAETDGAVREGVERFLALEAAGWKGAARTAMLSSSARTAFLRTATRLLVRDGLCRIHSLELDGAPAAMALVLTAGGTDFLWKIAYREELARFSPGVQLVLDVTAAQGGDGRAPVLDSCAVPHHAMIDRLWRDRIRLVDVAVSLRPGGGFRRAVALERAARRLRAGAKRLWGAWRGRRAPATGP